jgi:phosphatidylglycerophosphatase A
MKLHKVLATGLGTGYLPLFPGTWGSLLGILPAVFLPSSGFVIFLILLFFAGVWASERTALESLNKDPQSVVIDEVLGMGVSLLFLPKTILFFTAAFFLFRFFDVKKPFMIRKLEALPGGWGIMMDDLGAAVAANVILQSVHLVYLVSQTVR